MKIRICSPRHFCGIDRRKYGLTREQLDEYAYESHQRALRAQAEGRFTEEMVPVNGLDKDGNDIIVTADEGPRQDTSLEALAALKPVFKQNGKITAGNASQMSDGAAAVLLMERQTALHLGLKPKAKLLPKPSLAPIRHTCLTVSFQRRKSIAKSESHH